MNRTKLAYTLNILKWSKNVLELRLNQLCTVLEQDDPDIETALYADRMLTKIQSAAIDTQIYCRKCQDELAKSLEEAGYKKDCLGQWKNSGGNDHE